MAAVQPRLRQAPANAHHLAATVADGAGDRGVRGASTTSLVSTCRTGRLVDKVHAPFLPIPSGEDVRDDLLPLVLIAVQGRVAVELNAATVNTQAQFGHRFFTAGCLTRLRSVHAKSSGNNTSQPVCHRARLTLYLPPQNTQPLHQRPVRKRVPGSHCGVDDGK